MLSGDVLASNIVPSEGVIGASFCLHVGVREKYLPMLVATSGW